MYKLSALALALLIGMASLVGCSKDEDGGGDASSGDSATVDPKDPASVGKAALKALKANNHKALAEYCEGKNKMVVLEEAEDKIDKPLFDGDLGTAISEWDGEVGEVRYPNAYTAHIKFAELSADEWAVVTLTNVADKWYFEDVHSPSKSDFLAMSKEVPDE